MKKQAKLVDTLCDLAGCAAVAASMLLTTQAWSMSDPSDNDTPLNTPFSISTLATDDQKSLDALAISIYQNNNFDAEKAAAKSLYQSAHGDPISDEAAARLDQDIEELLFSAIQKAVNIDAYRPQVYWLNSPPKTWFGLNVPGGRYSYDNPDNIYRTIPIKGALHYEVHGQRYTPGPTDVTFSLIKNPNSQITVNLLTGNDLVVDADGSFTITIDSNPANGRINHIQSDDTAVQLFIRNNLGNWNTEIPDAITVERVDGTPAQTAPTEADIVTEAKKNMKESGLFYGFGALGLKTHTHPVNTIGQPETSTTLGTLVTQTSAFGHFQLAADEALVATLNPGGAGYFVFPVTDPWLVTVDPNQHQSSLNNVQAIPDSDGNYTFVVSREDPGVANWLDTAGLLEGTIMVRWQNLPATTPASGGPGISSQVVKLEDLNAVLPADTVYVTESQRQKIVRARVRGFERRIDTTTNESDGDGGSLMGVEIILGLLALRRRKVHTAL